VTEAGVSANDVVSFGGVDGEEKGSGLRWQRFEWEENDEVRLRKFESVEEMMI
jgi:hypothetical protein